MAYRVTDVRDVLESDGIARRTWKSATTAYAAAAMATTSGHVDGGTYAVPEVCVAPTMQTAAAPHGSAKRQNENVPSGLGERAGLARATSATMVITQQIPIATSAGSHKA
jgi:hypothetical protein